MKGFFMQSQVSFVPQDKSFKRKAALGVGAVFLTQFVSFLFINARNIAQPGMIAELDGMTLFSWLIALPALAGAAGTLLSGKLSDVYGRRAVLLASIGIFLLGLGLSAMVKSMPALVAVTTFMSIGHWPIIPLCLSAIGDLFPPAERAKWTGLLNLPSGIAALIGPVLGGVVAESAFGWRGLYWGTIPLMLTAAGLLAAALPNPAQTTRPKMDIWGMVVMVFATSTLIFGVSWLGEDGKSGMGAFLLLLSLAAWIGFLRIEKRAEAPILDPQILASRTFLTAAGTGLLSFFGTVSILAYSPIFVQEVMRVSPTVNGSMLTPYTVLAAFIGLPVGFWLSKTKKYKGVYVIGYALATLSLLMLWQLTAESPAWFYVLATSLAGLGLGALPMLNTLVAQFAVPRRLLGSAVGAVFFFQMVGIAVAPSLLGLLQRSAPTLEEGLKLVFLAGAIALLMGLLIILTIPQISMEGEPAEADEPLPAVLAEG
ncbi:MAG: MFS transporter [Anaerolineales bacterium]|nr:MFS transporter [Anaerolineales bacterium]